MVRHIVMWNLQDKLSAEEKKEAGLTIKKMLEALPEKIEGLRNARVVINDEDKCSRNVALYTELDSFEALDVYQVHPEHLKVKAYVGSVACDRIFWDFEV